MTITPQTPPYKDSLIWKDVLKPIYDEMRYRNRKNILDAQQMRRDDFFAGNPSRNDDERRCLAVSAVLDDRAQCQWSSDFDDLQATLLKEFSEDLHFAQHVETGKKLNGQLHWTLMQLVGFQEFDQEIGTAATTACRYYQPDYLNCIQDTLTTGGFNTPVIVDFVGVIAVGTGLLVIGVPRNVDANKARDQVRECLKDRNLPLKEPFVNDIIHSTLFRVCKTDEAATHAPSWQRLLEIAEKYQDVYLGSCTITKFQIGPASWRMLDCEIKVTPPWRTWELSEETTQA